jgi:hypothetical protein
MGIGPTHLVSWQDTHRLIDLLKWCLVESDLEENVAFCACKNWVDKLSNSLVRSSGFVNIAV